MGEFKRENRYLVIKRDDLEHVRDIMRPEIMADFDSVCQWVERIRGAVDKPPLCCVVVEHDWPEYEPTWTAIEKRIVEGRYSSSVMSLVKCPKCGLEDYDIELCDRSDCPMGSQKL